MNTDKLKLFKSEEEVKHYARVNGFLSAVRTGRFKSGKFDTDLLPKGHPLRSKD